MVNITNRQRFLDICHFQRRGDLYLGSLFNNLFWLETLFDWTEQKAPEFFGHLDSIQINEYFKFDLMHWMTDINSGVAYWGFRTGEIGATPIMPGFEPKVLDEDEQTQTYITVSGKTAKRLKSEPGNMPMFLDFPVKDRTTWESYKKRLDPNTPERYPSDWDSYVREINSLDCPVALQVGGFFGYLGQWTGIERLLYMFYDDPDLVEDMMDTMLYMESEIIRRVAKDIKFDMVTYWEDMAYNAGPMISPDMFRKFMMPRYKKLNEQIRSLGVDVIYMDSDGNIDLLIPLWLECGVNLFWPLEVAAGMDAVALRKKYGNDIILGGNIDKRVLIKGKNEIEAEVMEKVPFLLGKGGYFPSVDHMVPPDVPFDNFCYYINLMREIAGFEKIEFP